MVDSTDQIQTRRQPLKLPCWRSGQHRTRESHDVNAPEGAAFNAISDLLIDVCSRLQQQQLAWSPSRTSSHQTLPQSSAPTTHSPAVPASPGPTPLEFPSTRISFRPTVQPTPRSPLSVALLAEFSGAPPSRSLTSLLPILSIHLQDLKFEYNGTDFSPGGCTNVFQSH